MAAKFDLNDDGVVVVVGSGAGGGTLSNELAQKGIKVVCLEAGGRHEISDFENDEWNMFSKISWLDKRTTSGTWQVAQDFPGLPAWIVKSVGGSTVHWAGASLRFQEHEFRARTTYGDIAGANLLDWPITLAEMEPWYARAEDKMGVTGTNGIPRLPGNNNLRYWRPAPGSSATRNATPAIWRSTRSPATTAARASRSVSVSRAACPAPNGPPCTRKSPRARRRATWKSGRTPRC
jgi:choline dehydrogenase-like flavoprotein